MLWVWISIAIFTLVGIGLMVWRHEASSLQGMAFGARLHPGCAVAEGIVLLLLALAYFLVMQLR